VATAGTKRSLTCSPQFGYNSSNMPNSIDMPGTTEENNGNGSSRLAKRRRLHDNTLSVDSLSEHFSLHSPFFNKAGAPINAAHSNSLVSLGMLNDQSRAASRFQSSCRSATSFFAQPCCPILSPVPALPGAAACASSQAPGRPKSPSTSTTLQDVNRVIEEQAAMIESLKKDQTAMQTKMGRLQGENDKLSEDNRILRKAVKIQQERQKQSERELQVAREGRTQSEEHIRRLEQLVLTLRYHLQAQPSQQNDFMHLNHRPPDVY
jgi:hypothetical protein